MSSFPHFHSSGTSCQLGIFALALLGVLILCLTFQYERFWKEPSKTSVAWIGLLYAIMCLSAQYYVSSNPNPDPHHTDLGMQPQYLSCEDERTMWQLLCGRLNYLKLHLLERLSTERGGASKRELFEVTRESLHLTVFLWVHRDRSIDKVHDYDYMAYILSRLPITSSLACTLLIFGAR